MKWIQFNSLKSTYFTKSKISLQIIYASIMSFFSLWLWKSKEFSLSNTFERFYLFPMRFWNMLFLINFFRLLKKIISNHLSIKFTLKLVANTKIERNQSIIIIELNISKLNMFGKLMNLHASSNAALYYLSLCTQSNPISDILERRKNGLMKSYWINSRSNDRALVKEKETAVEKQLTTAKFTLQCT